VEGGREEAEEIKVDVGWVRTTMCGAPLWLSRKPFFSGGEGDGGGGGGLRTYG